MNINEKLLLWLVLNEKIKIINKEISLDSNTFTEGRRTLSEMLPGKERAKLSSALSKMVKNMKGPSEARHKLIKTWMKIDKEIEEFIKGRGK